MKNSWLIWVFIIGVVITVFVAFNYQDGSNSVPLAEIFPESENYPVDIEYEFVDEDVVPQSAQVEISDASEETADVLAATPEPVVEAPKPVAVQAAAISAEVETQPTSQPIINTNNIPYTIQVASFRDKTKAAQKIEELKKKDYSGYIVSRDLGEKGTWHRVYVGSFEKKAEAKDFLINFKKNYKDSFVISPRKPGNSG